MEQQTDAGDMFIILMIILPIMGNNGRKKIGLKYWLYDSFEGFDTSIGVPFGGFLSFIQLKMLHDGENPSYIFLAICLLFFIYWSTKTYKISAEQTYNKKDAIGLFLGKTVFATATLGLLLFLAMLFTQRKKV